MTFLQFLVILVTSTPIKSFSSSSRLSPMTSITTLSKQPSDQIIQNILSIYPSDSSIPSSSIPLIANTKIAGSCNIHNYIVANPSYFLANSEFAAEYSVQYSPDMSIIDYVSKLPVIYIAETHPEYGVLGFQLNNKSPKVINDIFPAYRTLRTVPIYRGGYKTAGSAFTMIHRKVGFPDNRAFKVLPSRKDCQLFFSPNIAMANELISTKDAKPSDFKFFEWATNWLPNQLDIEYSNRAWIAIEAPLDVIFAEENKDIPLWVQLVKSALTTTSN